MSAAAEQPDGAFRPRPVSPAVSRSVDPKTRADAGRFPVERVAFAFRHFLESLGLDLADPNLVGTDRRVARAFEEMLSGLRHAEPELSTFPNSKAHSGLVCVAEIPFYSICAHHFLPFFGQAHVGYVPGTRLLGLSKFARVVDFFARRPQIQEDLTEQVADLLDRRLAPAGLIVAMEGRHLCMEMRGISRPGVITKTMAVRGTMEDESLQHQFFSRLGASRQ
jgi:GTP cyclohydrolase I